LNSDPSPEKKPPLGMLPEKRITALVESSATALSNLDGDYWTPKMQVAAPSIPSFEVKKKIEKVHKAITTWRAIGQKN
jgi:hypothetical protein